MAKLLRSGEKTASVTGREGPVIRAQVYGGRSSKTRKEGMQFMWVLALPNRPKSKVAGRTTPTGCFVLVRGEDDEEQSRPVFCTDCRHRWICPYSLVTDRYIGSRSVAKGTVSKRAGTVKVVYEEDLRMAKKAKKLVKAKAKTESKGKKRSGTIIALVREIFAKDHEIETAKVISMIQKQFPKSAVNAAHVGFYRAKMRDEGILP